MEKLFLIFLGPPGSGKGTQVDLLCEQIGGQKISIGDLLRREKEASSELGRQAKDYMLKGELVPDDLIKKLVVKQVRQEGGGRSLVFDGYPRNLSQLNDLLQILKKQTEKGNSIYAIEVAVSDGEVKKRLGGRRVCVCGAVYHLKYNPPETRDMCNSCGKKLFIRDDDKIETINNRLNLYHKESRPIIEYWQKEDRLIKINGEQDIKKIHEDIMNSLKKLNLI